MRTTSSIQFYCRQSKATKSGLAPVELSLIINGQRVFINLPRKESPSEFKKAVTSRRDNDTKKYLHEVRSRFNEIQTDMMRNNIPLTATALKEYFRTGGIRSYQLKDLWDDYLKIAGKRVGVTMTEMAYRKYISARNTMYEYISPDTDVKAITPAAIQDLLASIQAKYKESSTCSIMTKIKTVIIFAKDNGKIEINPFQNIKYGRGSHDIEYLTEEEISSLVNRHFEIDRLEKVRDLAVFQICSGMAYIDTQQLTPEDIHYEEDGTCYIYKSRRKTGVKYTSVVLPEGIAILKKYNGKLPSISNQKGNAYLKEVQTLCGITKPLHFHLFRKTYGTRLLNKGVRLETVSKCLGHSTTQITQMAYAKLLRPTIIQEVKEAFK